MPPDEHHAEYDRVASQDQPVLSREPLPGQQRETQRGVVEARKDPSGCLKRARHVADGGEQPSEVPEDGKWNRTHPEQQRQRDPGTGCETNLAEPRPHRLDQDQHGQDDEHADRHLGSDVGPRWQRGHSELTCPTRRAFGGQSGASGVQRCHERTERAHRHHEVLAPGKHPVDECPRTVVVQEEHVEHDRKAHGDCKEPPTAQQACELEAPERDQPLHGEPAERIEPFVVRATNASSRRAPVTSRSRKATALRTRSRTVASASRETSVTPRPRTSTSVTPSKVSSTWSSGRSQTNRSRRVLTAAFKVAPGPSATTRPWLITTTRPACSASSK